MKKTVFDFKASLSVPNWQHNFTWMLSEQDIEKDYAQQEQNIIHYAENIDNKKKQNLFLLSIKFIKVRVNGLFIATLAVQNSQKQSIDLISTIPEFNYLKTGKEKYLKNKFKQIVIDPKIKLPFLRRIVRTLSWTKWWKLPLTIIKPDVIAVGHNEVLVRKAQLSKKRVYFYQYFNIIDKANKLYKKQPLPDYYDELCEDIYKLLIDETKLETKCKKRLKELACDFINQSIKRDFHALEALYQYQKLPKNIWIGTGGGYSFRLLALATLYKKGNAVGFSHSTTPILIFSKENNQLQELAVVSEFVGISPKAKEIISKLCTKNINPNISFIDGCPFFKNQFHKTKKIINKKKQKPTIIYISSPVYDLNKNPIFSNAMVYLDWQLRLTAMLDKMNINLICQPHPEGIFKDKNLTHPLLEKYSIPKCRFEKVMQHADIFLIDCIYSTAVGHMFISNKPIVRISLLDSSNSYGVREDIRPMVDKRCRNIKAWFDDDNLLYVDKKELEYALTNNWQEKVDSTEFRELLIGG